ncbi:MAG: choline dehydrogenase [Pseudomonadota bacterium]
MNEFDYIIIGAGSSGGFLAYRLSEDPSLKILLLEAGLSDNHWTTTMPAGARYTFDGGPRTWSFETQPEPNMAGRKLDQPRGKVLGGSSSLNGMVFVRGHRADYDRWEAEGATGWGYDDVLPFFKSIETNARGADDYRGGKGPIQIQRYTDNHPIEDAFIEAGLQAGHIAPADYNGADQEGVTSYDANIDGGYRSGTARACVAVAARRPNVTVLTEARVLKINIEHSRATGVTYQRHGQTKVAHAGHEVLLSAGAFQSPQLLMLSGLGPADHLREHGIDVLADLPGLGENLQDHLEVHIKHLSPHRGISKNKYLKKHRMLMAGAQWFLNKTGPAASGPSRVGGFFKSDTAKSHPDIQFHFWPYYAPGWLPDPSKDGYSFDVGPVQSQSRGWVKLDSADPMADPRIQLNGLNHDQDFVEFREAIRLGREMAAQRAFDFCRGPEVYPGPDVKSNADIDDFVRANAGSAYHPCGTARMGTDEGAVVDPEARVRGIEGLRVVDASIIPSITNGNINAPCMMIGERVAHMILGRGSA